MSSATTAIAAIVLIAIVVVGAYGLYNWHSSNSSHVAIQMTDPASVPAGTSAMFVSYSNVQIESSNGSSQASTWTSAQGSGTINILTLNNSAQTMASAYVRQNSTINAVKYNIDSVTIVVNGTSHAVTPGNSTVMVNVNGNQKVNSTTSAVIVDMAPTVSAQPSANSTSYVMVANAGAAVVVNANVTVGINTAINSTTQLGSTLKSRLGINIG